MKNPAKTLLMAMLWLLALGSNLAHAAAPVITNIFMVPRLTIQSDIGITNQIQFSTNLTQSNWVVLTNLVVSQSPYIFVDSTITNGTQRFYRVLALIPPPSASRLSVSGLSSPRAAGVAGNFTVAAMDSNNAVVTGYLGTVHFTSSDPSVTLPTSYTFTVGDFGVHTFSATLNTVGIQSLTAADTINGSISGTQSSITVTPAAATTLTVSGFPSSQTAGVSGSLSVQAKDSFGNLATGYRGTVHFTSSDPSAAMPSDYAFTAGDAGTHTFSATLKTVGSQSITASDAVTASITGTQSGIVVTPAAAASLTVSGFPSSQTAGVSGNLSVQVKDAFGNLASGYRGTVHFTSSDSSATLPANYTFTAGDAGVHAFSATLKTAGIQTISASDTVNSFVTGTGSGIAVTPAAATSLSVSGFPSPQAAGSSANFIVQARDPFGNSATSYRGTVHFTTSDASSPALPADYTFSAGDSGVHTFSATLNTVGTQSITATDTVNGSINGSETGITIIAGAASVIVLNSGNNQVGIAGTQLAQQLAVKVTDAGGNPVAGTTVTWAATAGGTGVGVTSPTSITSASGIATTTATLGSTGGANTFTATVSGLTGSPVTFSATAAKNLVLNGGNNQVDVAGAQLATTLSIKVTDNAANPVAGITVNWAATAGGTGVAVASPTSITSASGIATTTATLGSTGGANTFTATVSGLTGSPVTFTATAAKNLAVNNGNNQTGVAGTLLATPFAVKVTDNAANPIAGITVTWAATAGGTGVAVSSPSSITSVSGIATTSATLGSSGGANTFTATVSGLTGSPISFSATAAKSIAVNSGNNQTATAGHQLTAPLVVKITDNASNPVSGITVNWSVFSGGTGAAVSSSSSITDASGLAQINATVGTTAGANSFRATVTGLTGSPVTFNATGL